MLVNSGGRFGGLEVTYLPRKPMVAVSILAGIGKLSGKRKSYARMSYDYVACKRSFEYQLAFVLSAKLYSNNI
ncbi:hypothetical protein TNCV_3392161 [Trichonephila clavipes]|nr:hypothetical protein TNCV_3392161 [Trichonephila clavipes]